MWFFGQGPVIPVLRFSGPIGMATPLRPGLSIGHAASAIEKAFELSKTPAVAVVVNSPGGSPVQSSLIFRRIRQLAEEKHKTVYVFCEDVAASGGYYLALAGDEIYADPSSIVGSIGVIFAGFGLDKAIAKLGIERRVYTAGAQKDALDPFRPEKPEDIERIKSVQRDVHDVFIGIVKERRAGRLTGADAELFSGAFWSGPKALELGLIDGISDVRTKMRELYGDKVRLKVVPLEKGGLLGRLRRSSSAAGYEELRSGRLAFGEDLISAVEARSLWSRFGL
jgi:signal peptide peptidase SppA